MRYRFHSFRHAEVVLQEAQFLTEYQELIGTIDNITEADIIVKHESYPAAGARRPKSISVAINELFDERLTHLGWHPQSPIFQAAGYTGETWRLDFAKQLISLEVAFNHSTVIAWNLIKPVLASELNHVRNAIQTEVGIIICATNSMRAAGGFDGAIGTYEKFLTYLDPLRDLLSVPILLIGLEAPDTFDLRQASVNGRKEGFIRMVPGAAAPIVLGLPPAIAVPLPVEPLVDEPDVPGIEE
jgi:hypothetical protein